MNRRRCAAARPSGPRARHADARTAPGAAPRPGRFDVCHVAWCCARCWRRGGWWGPRYAVRRRRFRGSGRCASPPSAVAVPPRAAGGWRCSLRRSPAGGAGPGRCAAVSVIHGRALAGNAGLLALAGLPTGAAWLGQLALPAPARPLACGAGWSCAPALRQPATAARAGRAAVAHPPALPVQHAEHRDLALVRVDRRARRRCWRIWPSCSASRWPSGGESVSLAGRSSWRAATWPSSRCASASAAEYRLGARREGGRRARVPPLLLQPLVENAVRHGVSQPPRAAVRIRTRVKLGRAQVVIANTVPAAPCARQRHGAEERARAAALMHDMAARFEARRVDGAFRVHLVVPL